MISFRKEAGKGMECQFVPWRQESMLSVVKDNAAQLLKQFGLEDDMDRHVTAFSVCAWFVVTRAQSVNACRRQEMRTWRRRSCWRRVASHCKFMLPGKEQTSPHLAQGIFKKFARLASLAAGRNEATAEELAGYAALHFLLVAVSMLEILFLPCSVIVDARTDGELLQAWTSQPEES